MRPLACHRYRATRVVPSTRSMSVPRNNHRSSSAAGLMVRIDVRAADGLQRQIYRAVRGAILEGVLQPGTRLPSSRALAEDLRVSRTTTLLAYEQLLAEGYLETRHGSGTFVAGDLPDDLPQLPSPQRLPPSQHPPISRSAVALATVPPAARRLGGPPRAFRLGAPALDRFPLRLWSQLVSRRLRSMTLGHLDYADLLGCLDLRQAIVEHVQAARGTTCSADQVFVVAGAQRALQLICSVLLDPGDRVWLEEPGYPGARGALTQAGARIVPVGVDSQGLNVASATRRASDARMAYVTPSNQFPLGVPMSPMRRLALLKWAARAGAWIVEDDYDSEFRYRTRPLQCLHGLDAGGRVIYVGTFAKSIFPTMRLGFVIVPTDLREYFRAARRAADLHPPVLEQMALADFIREGHYATHLRRMRAVYRERREALEAGAKEFCDGVLRLRPIQSGLHAVADLDGIDAESVCHEARARGLEVERLGTYYVGRRTLNGLVLGFASTPPDTLRRGMERLAIAIDAVRRAIRAQPTRAAIDRA
jgi:GntR family transcriptional regulator / MocR family aminotransferase